VPLLAAAVLPHPPILVPEVAGGAAAELDDLRAACDEAVSRVLAAQPAVVCVVGSAEETREYWFPYRASFAPWGVPVEAHLGQPHADTPALPLSVAVGVWLLSRRVPARRPIGWRVLTVAADTPPAECARLGERICRGASRAGTWAGSADQRSSRAGIWAGSADQRWSVGLLVMGDGPAGKDTKAPGYADPRADPFDASVTKALVDADPAGLLALDPALAAELMAAGRAPWQVLAGAPGTYRGEVLYDAAPYGVQYTVASWLPT
jgi:hypothetical protein